MKKIFLFDCDQTIWTSSNDNDYLGSVFSPLVLTSENSITRAVDGKVFSLKPQIRKFFGSIYTSGNIAGVISDNRKDMVINALRLFGIYKFINPDAVNIKLWKGYCPKHKMVLEILRKPEFKSIPLSNTCWLDDKDYSEEANSIGVSFVRIGDATLETPRDFLDWIGVK